MRIAFLMRVDAFDKPGGDLLQVQKYLDAGRQIAPGSSAGFDGEVIHALDADLSSFDVVHLTNLDRPVELYHYYLAAKAAGKPIVVSTIHHSYREIAAYERKGRGGIVGAVAGWLGFQRVEYARSLIRSCRYPSLLKPTLRVLYRGMRQCQIAVLNHSGKLLVLTAKEQADIVADFGLLEQDRFELLPNGHETSSLSEARRDLEVCVVGRLEARKNQIAVVQALSQLGVKATFAGRENPNHVSYCRRFRSAAGKASCRFLEGLDHHEVLALMRRSRVHVSASWFEVSSLVDLEAYFAGCSVVSSCCGGTHEILGDRAVYVDPSSVDSIREGIAAALARSEAGPAQIDQGLVATWNQIGATLARVYRQAVGSARLSPPAS